MTRGDFLTLLISSLDYAPCAMLYHSEIRIPKSAIESLCLLTSVFCKKAINMIMGRYGLIGIVLTLTLVVFAGFSAKVSAANTVVEIHETALDAKISDKKNRLAVVFMAAWCGPCIDELPTLNKLHKQFKSQGLEIIGISIDLDGVGAMQPSVNALKIDFPVYWYGEKAVEKFALFAIPMMLLVKQGEIVERIHGRRPGSYLNKKFHDLLK